MAFASPGTAVVLMVSSSRQRGSNQQIGSHTKVLKQGLRRVDLSLFFPSFFGLQLALYLTLQKQRCCQVRCGSRAKV
jgi:hypothetical protein